MSSSTYDIAYYYCVSHIPAATIPASRLSNILDTMHQGRPLTAYSLNYLLQQNLPGLYQLATGQISYDAYITALDPAFVASQQIAQAEYQAKEAQRLAREAEYLRSRAALSAASGRNPKNDKSSFGEVSIPAGEFHKADSEAQRKLRRQREREASEAVLKAQRVRQAELAEQRDRNRKAAAATYHVRTSDPDYIVPTSHDIACYYHVNYIPGMVSPPMSDILDALIRGIHLTQDDLNYLKLQAPAALHQLALGRITFDSYIATVEAAEAAETARKARVEAAEAARVARESDPDYIAMMQTRALCREYGIDLNGQSPPQRMTTILRSVDSGNRLPKEDFVWLKTAGKRYFTEKLQKAYHQKEAEFYASEYSRTLDPWNVVNASGHYRKCDQPERALELLDSFATNRLKHPKIKSAVCTTRGGVMRDLGRRPEALQLGDQAHELQPQDFRPCTLLGAVHMELGDFDSGREWYAKAAERGASEHSIDTELRSIFQRADKASRAAMKIFLLAEDPKRYRWVNDKRYQDTAVAGKS
ncbi:cell envelope integrity protein TolA [Candidatus Accumulibacter aalborgensis]|nr:cell envelope integrity protein TolA [Candidatus Accumulibacter aalborgensis]